jgi:hypothetical protein
MTNLMGIDLNGLCDVSVEDVGSARKTTLFRGGNLPSVVVVQPRGPDEPINVIAGEEAAMAVEGRGWHWPDAAQVGDHGQGQRVPIFEILKAIADNRSIDAAGEDGPPTKLLGAAIEALARPRAGAAKASDERKVIISVPDDNRFLEAARQRVIDAATNSGLAPTLLWRPVAAVLGLGSHLPEHIEDMHGREIGVLSCLEDGVHAARLTMEVAGEEHARYLVPVRNGAGTAALYRRPISALATELARRLAPDDDPREGWQLNWGSGLAQTMLLHAEAEISLSDRIVQTKRGWDLVPDHGRADLPEVEFEPDDLRRLAKFLEKVNYTIFEGPALEAGVENNYLPGFLGEHLVPDAQALIFATRTQNLAAHGCAAYQDRIAKGQATYKDQLPQLRLAASRERADPEFVDLLRPDQLRAIGGKPSIEECELDFKVSPGTRRLEFYLVREGKARHVRIDLHEPVREEVPIMMRIRQEAAQGTARLTLIGADANKFRPVEIHWERMEEVERTEDEILETLRQEPVKVPPVHTQLCHTWYWSQIPRGGSGALTTAVPQLFAHLNQDEPPIEDIRDLLGDMSNMLTSRGTPMTQNVAPTQGQDVYRAVSSDGQLPQPGGALTQDILDSFDDCLRRLDEMTADTGSVAPQFLSDSVRFAGWCFLHCPAELRDHLFRTASDGHRSDLAPLVYYGAMGKVFTTADEFRAFFGFLERDLKAIGSKFKSYQIEGLWYLLSLREQAPLFLSDDQATLFATKILDRIEDKLRKPAAPSRLIKSSMRAYAGLIRYRLKRGNFLTPEDGAIEERQRRVFQKLLDRCDRANVPRIAALTEEVIKFLENRGTDSTILQWDD